MHFLRRVQEETGFFSYFSDLFHGCDARKWLWRPASQMIHADGGNPWTCEQSGMQKYSVLFYRCNLLERLFFFPTPHPGGVGSPSLCVLVRIDRHPCVTKWHEVLAWISRTENPGYFKAHYWLREPPTGLDFSGLPLTDSIRVFTAHCQVLPWPHYGSDAGILVPGCCGRGAVTKMVSFYSGNPHI